MHMDDKDNTEDGTITLDPRAALEFLGKASRGRFLVGAHAVSKDTRVKRPEVTANGRRMTKDQKEKP